MPRTETTIHLLCAFMLQKKKKNLVCLPMVKKFFSLFLNGKVSMVLNISSIVNAVENEVKVTQHLSVKKF